MVFKLCALAALRVSDNVAFGLKEQRVPPQQIKSKVAAALELVDLAPWQPHTDQLSGGQQQRIALARTSRRAEVLLLDEPLSNRCVAARSNAPRTFAPQRQLG